MLKRKTLSLMLGAAGVLAGCASPSGEVAALRVEPVISIRDATGSARGKYELGRYYQGQLRFEEAARAYELAFALDPGQTLAANNLGVIEAGQGRYEQAIGHFRAALERQPDAAVVHNNLGYAYLLQKRNSEAQAEFEEALRLEPGNVRAAANLKVAQQRLSLAPASLPLAAPHDHAATPADAALAVVQPAPVRIADRAPARVELSNGNGVNGMALRLRSFLLTKGIATSRLTNDRPFVRQETKIAYRSGFEASARDLNAKLPHEVDMVESSNLRRGVDVRLILGKDIASVKAGSATTAPAWLSQQDMPRHKAEAERS